MYIPRDPFLMRDPLMVTRNRLLTRVSAPASEPVTLTEAKTYLRVDDTNSDDLITDLIVAARMVAESWLRRSLITQSWQLAYDYGIPDCVWLPMGPVNSITSVVLVNRDTTTVTLDPSAYWLSAAQNTLMFDSMQIAFQIQITYAAGYGSSATDVPKPVKQGILSHIGAMFDSRGEDGTAALPEQAVALYLPFREVRL
ncbi:MAG: head-tail connector protein [Pseudomonadota bacterium]|nr:head-tail connector protein [Pseudomonadota bacterium]